MWEMELSYVTETTEPRLIANYDTIDGKYLRETAVLCKPECLT